MASVSIFSNKATHVCIEVCEDNSNLRFRQSNCFVSYFMNELQKLLLMQKLPDQLADQDLLESSSASNLFITVQLREKTKNPVNETSDVPIL